MLPTKSKVYHERQTRQLCALHTLNNLFQCKFGLLYLRRAYTRILMVLVHSFTSSPSIYQRAVRPDLH